MKPSNYKIDVNTIKGNSIKIIAETVQREILRTYPNSNMDLDLRLVMLLVLTIGNKLRKADLENKYKTALKTSSYYNTPISAFIGQHSDTYEAVAIKKDDIWLIESLKATPFRLIGNLTQFDTVHRKGVPTESFSYATALHRLTQQARTMKLPSYHYNGTSIFIAFPDVANTPKEVPITLRYIPESIEDADDNKAFIDSDLTADVMAQAKQALLLETQKTIVQP